MAIIIDRDYFESVKKPRKENSSKGDFGTLLMLCGSPYMTGAAYLAAQGAMRSGLGLLRAAGSAEVLAKLQTILFEPVFTLASGIDFSKCTAFLCGCGISGYYDDILPSLFEKCRVPAVLDADALNFISRDKSVLKKIDCPVTVTPHPGEMSRLTGVSVERVQSDREGAAERFAREYGVTVVLKGSGTVVASPDGRVAVNTSGSSALAKGGSGDVLAGVIASLNAQGYDAFAAAAAGVYAHGAAGDILSESYGKSGVLPGDLPKVIGSLLG